MEHISGINGVKFINYHVSKNIAFRLNILIEVVGGCRKIIFTNLLIPGSTVFGNGGVMLVVLLTKTLRSPTFTLIVCLAVSHLPAKSRVES